MSRAPLVSKDCLGIVFEGQVGVFFCCSMVLRGSFGDGFEWEPLGGVHKFKRRAQSPLGFLRLGFACPGEHKSQGLAIRPAAQRLHPSSGMASIALFNRSLLFGQSSSACHPARSAAHKQEASGCAFFEGGEVLKRILRQTQFSKGYLCCYAPCSVCLQDRSA